MRKLVDVLYLPLGAAALGGAERSLLELADGISRRGLRVAIAAGRALAGTPYPDLVAARGLDIVWHDASPGCSVAYNWRAFAALFRQFDARIVHFNVSWRAGMWLAALAARRETRARLIGTMRAMPEPHQGIPRRRHFGLIPGLQLWRLHELFYGYVWSRTLDATVSINRDDFPRRLARDYFFKPSEIYVIYNGIAMPALLNAAERRASRAAFGIGQDRFVLVFAGRLAVEKGVGDLLTALAQLPERVVAVIAGTGPDEERLRTLAANLQLEARVRFTGFLTDVRPALCAADVMVVPSNWAEPFGRVVPEAMGLGLPVIATRVGGMAELFENGVQGIYIPQNNPTALAAAAAQLEGDRDVLAAMGRAARACAEGRYDISRVIAQYAALYRGDAPAGGKPGLVPRAD
jgi:glycosyltransferase involved in cell wall biosynthesis